MNTYNSNEIAEACMNAEISDSQYESLMLELRVNKQPAGEAVPAKVVSIDTPEFCDLITELQTAHGYISGDKSKEAWRNLIAHIDAKLAEALSAERIRTDEIWAGRERYWSQANAALAAQVPQAGKAPFRPEYQQVQDANGFWSRQLVEPTAPPAIPQQAGPSFYGSVTNAQRAEADSLLVKLQPAPEADPGFVPPQAGQAVDDLAHSLLREVVETYVAGSEMVKVAGLFQESEISTAEEFINRIRAALAAPPASAAPVDPIVELNVAMLRSRSAVGIAKYGTTLADNPLSLQQWLSHALEESLDQANYLQAAIQKLK